MSLGSCRRCFCGNPPLVSPSCLLAGMPALTVCALLMWLHGRSCLAVLQAASEEELFRRHGQAVTDSFRRMGVLAEQLADEAAAPGQQQEPPVAVAAATSKGPHEAPASDTPTGVLDLQQHHQLHTSSEEQEVEAAAGREQAPAIETLHLRRGTAAAF